MIYKCANTVCCPESQAHNISFVQLAVEQGQDIHLFHPELYSTQSPMIGLVSATEYSSFQMSVRSERKGAGSLDTLRKLNVQK